LGNGSKWKIIEPNSNITKSMKEERKKEMEGEGEERKREREREMEGEGVGKENYF
jgi:hypothetical protein